jgi:hypothetical protein
MLKVLRSSWLCLVALRVACAVLCCSVCGFFEPPHMTVQGIGRQQQLQSSPHQQACLMGILGPLEEVVELVDGGMLVAVVVERDRRGDERS